MSRLCSPIDRNGTLRVRLRVYPSARCLTEYVGKSFTLYWLLTHDFHPSCRLLAKRNMKDIARTRIQKRGYLHSNDLEPKTLCRLHLHSYPSRICSVGEAAMPAHQSLRLCPYRQLLKRHHNIERPYRWLQQMLKESSRSSTTF